MQTMEAVETFRQQVMDKRYSANEADIILSGESSRIIGMDAEHVIKIDH